MRALILCLLLLPALAFAHDPGDNYTSRDPAKVRAFRKLNPCPSTHKITGACPTHVVDHKWPRCAGGPDEPWNMQWQEKRESFKKDAIERRVCKDIRNHKSGVSTTTKRPSHSPVGSGASGKTPAGQSPA